MLTITIKDPRTPAQLRNKQQGTLTPLQPEFDKSLQTVTPNDPFIVLSTKLTYTA